MESKRKTVKAVILPANKGKKGQLAYNFNHDLIILKENINKKNCLKINLKPQHLYFISNEEIKEGDWVLEMTGLDYMNHPVKATMENIKVNEYIRRCKKIIATTDKSLTYKTSIEGSVESLPQPSQTFIKRYCEFGGIDEVDVEYEIHNHPDLGEVDYTLKVNSHNEIIIYSIKNSWSREELERKSREDFNAGMNYAEATHVSVPNEDKWIKQNL